MAPVDTIKMIKDVYNVDPSEIVKEEIIKGQLVISCKDGSEKGIKIDYLEEKGLGGRRENCRRCSLKIPTNADLALGNWGVTGDLKGKATFVDVCSKKGAEIFEGMRDIIYAVSGFGIIAIAVGGLFGNFNWKWLGAIIIGNWRYY